MLNATKKYGILALMLAIFLVSFFNIALAAKPTVPPGKGNGPPSPPPEPPGITEQIKAELDYIAYSSWSEFNPNASGWKFLDPNIDIYGAINSNRIPSQGVPNRWGWVRPGIAAMAAIGVMQGAAYLDSQGVGHDKYDQALDKFFLQWELAHEQGQNKNADDPDYGAFMDRVDYDSSGNYNAGITPLWKTEVTAQMMIANWKYYEYKNSIGQSQAASQWLANAWPIQERGADYLLNMYNNTPAGTINLLPGNSSPAEYIAWIHFAAYAVPALRAASVWANMRGEVALAFDYTALVDNLVIGIQTMKDESSQKNYFKFRPYANGAYGAPTYGDSIDQLVFSPYETGAIPPDEFAGQISDWWTNGDGQLKMTYQTNDESDWRYFGTRWHYYFTDQSESDYLYPGPGFQLAKVEWKYGQVLGGNNEYLARSDKRLKWGTLTNYSALWWFLTGEQEVKTPNGFLDWRSANNYSSTAEGWARFVDSSAYFIEVLLMNNAGIDSDYNPIS